MVRMSSRARDKAQIVCFTCNEQGHYSYKFPKKVVEGMPTNNSLNKDISSYGLDMDYVKLNNITVPAVFYSGDCESVITSRLLKRLGNFKCMDTNKVFKFIDGSSVKVTRMEDLSIEYKEKRVNERFNIVNNKHDEPLLLGNSLERNYCL
ncbi:hypothetical protein NGRA_2006 [Nosema granulosis]|uniref:CCHC-type domain-containing protein n=1 Tax=Nosema granulosis TaxID=83296 RepID=A0A9P6GXB9_9MICR|nr:hypothetical protein NGRA_2006 [Nosema granulosis]